ncbi:MAG TPA: cytochrome c-type biogenesis protein CcmH [Rubrivivax sp.]|nr:cytochrome c-type biogenesis protein CcmH [Rubrivivax sp.]
MKALWAACLAMLVAVAALADTARDVVADPALELRVNRLAAELRCLVCQNQSLADSHAPLAIDLKNQVREQLAGGRDERQVIDYMTQRYGDFVLYRPPLKPSTMLLWAGPALLLLLGAALFWRSLLSAQQAPAQLPMSEADSARAEQLLAGDALPRP